MFRHSGYFDRTKAQSNHKGKNESFHNLRKHKHKFVAVLVLSLSVQITLYLLIWFNDEYFGPTLLSNRQEGGRRVADSFTSTSQQRKKDHDEGIISHAGYG